MLKILSMFGDESVHVYQQRTLIRVLEKLKLFKSK